MIPGQHQPATPRRLARATSLGAIAILAWLAFLPAVAHAQATIAGTVRDTSGAILPGVTVEASSPALIEKVRSATTDGAGLYRIENLRPGDYTVTFTLPGFSTVRREGLELNAFLTATINAELKVGGVEETITVTGETPVVDIQSAQRQTVLTNEVISAIPTVGSYNALLVLVPAIFGGQQDVSTGPCNSCTFSSHGTLLDGGRANREARLLVDGISIAVPQAGGTNYLTDTRNAQEVSFTTSGSLGEVESGGPVMNIVPKSGGNTAVGRHLHHVGKRRPAGQQLLRRAEGRRTHGAESAHQGLRFQQLARRSDQPRPTVVLRHAAVPGELELHREHVREQERGRSHQVDL